MYNYYSQKGSMIENDRVKSQGMMLSSTKSDLLTNQRHLGCLERIMILTQELDRMAEAQYQANELIEELKQELSLYESCNMKNGCSLENNREQELYHELILEKQKFNQYKNLKEQEVEQLENELNIVHKDVKQLKLLNFDLNHKYELKCNELIRMNEEIQQLRNQQQDENNQSGMLNQLHEDVLELQNNNKILKQQNQGYENKIQELMQYIEGMQTSRQQSNQYQQQVDSKQQLKTLEDQLFPSRKDEIIRKYSKYTKQRTESVNVSFNQHIPLDQQLNYNYQNTQRQSMSSKQNTQECENSLQNNLNEKSLTSQLSNYNYLTSQEQKLNSKQNTQVYDDVLQNNSSLNQLTIKREQLRSKAKPVSQFQLTTSRQAQYI